MYCSRNGELEVIQHVLIDIVDQSDELFQKITSILGECVLACTGGGVNGNSISLYKCGEVALTLYKLRKELLIDVLGGEDTLVYKILNVLPRERVIVRFIERGVSSQS